MNRLLLIKIIDLLFTFLPIGANDAPYKRFIYQDRQKPTS